MHVAWTMAVMAMPISGLLLFATLGSASAKDCSGEQPSADCVTGTFGPFATTGGLVDAPYIDDRSSPSKVIVSYYSAVNLKQYARAYTYFADGPYPYDEAAYEAFKKGYEKTESIELLIGTPEGDGAAGTIFTYVPVAIRAKTTDGGASVFSGCYTTRLAGPNVQDAIPFSPEAISAGKLRPSDKPFEASVPDNYKDCNPDG